jgi:hypothetical protein
MREIGPNMVIGPLRPKSYPLSEKKLLTTDDSDSVYMDNVLPVVRKMIMDNRLVEVFILAEQYNWASPISNCLRCRLVSPAEHELIMEAVKELVDKNKADVALNLLQVLADHPAFETLLPRIKDCAIDAF